MLKNQPSETPSKTCTVSAHGFTVIYDLLCDRSNGRTFYSIKVSLLPKGETATVYDITSDPDLTHRIFDMICSGIVTPCCIFEVVEDLIESIP